MSCSKKDTISFEKLFKVTGNIYKNTVSGKIPIPDATIGFNANFDTTNIHGNFLFENIFSITLVNPSTGCDRKMLATIPAKKRQTCQTIRPNPANKQLITVFDLIEQTHKCFPADQIAAVTCRGRAYRVD